MAPTPEEIAEEASVDEGTKNLDLVEVEENWDDNKEETPAELASIEASLGWFPLPEIKLASWHPEEEKQWNVSFRINVCHFICSCN
mmetsp:Transcript_4597/g.6535  ORF Transcript_4597/g.6535 Transcript_4597/m.6535 type:complete len:86 (-) Transcript_4597:2220-2477(-)